ncbi:MAG: hypothetical protein JWP57_4478 [Spirosoma sp.]|nr:hypothetical protein [Spirosoma sp.]
MGRRARTSFLAIYINELYWLARESTEICQKIFASAPPALAGRVYHKASRNLQSDLYAVLNNAARMKNLE